MSLKVAYNTKAKIAAIGPSVWAKLGPENWFDEYKILCANSRGYRAPFVVDLGIQSDELERFTTQNIIDMPRFQQIVLEKFSDYRFVAYRPVVIPSQLPADAFVANDISYSRFEEKHEFRKVFRDILPIPDFVVIDNSQLFWREPIESYNEFAAHLGTKFVLQDELGGGGRGTFIVESVDELESAVATLKAEHKGEQCIVSRFIPGIERSIQVFVSEERFIPGPIQQQLVRNPELLNPQGRGGMFFCGGRFIFGESQTVVEQIETIVEASAAKLRSTGYKGIFGMDFIVDESGKVHVLEINARTTGLLPLLNEQQSEVPLYLLHILELAEEPYSIAVDASLTPFGGPKSFVVLFNQTGSSASFDATISTGNYAYKDGSFEKLDAEARWNPGADLMLQLFCSPEFPAKQNLKLCNIFLRESGFDDKGVLTQDAQQIVAHLKAHIKHTQA